MSLTPIGSGAPAVTPPAPARPGTGTSTQTSTQTPGRQSAPHPDHAAEAKQAAAREQADKPKPLPPLKGLSVSEIRIILGAIPAPHLPAVKPADGGAGKAFDSYV
jgi:hypothetical protein